MNEDKIVLKGKLKSYLQWPIVLSVLWAVMVAALFFINVKAGLIAAGFLAIYVIIVLLLYFGNRQQLLNELITFAAQYGQVQKNLLKDFVLPYALTDSDGNLLWMNDEFSAICGKNRSYHKNIATLFPEIRQETLPGEDIRTECEMKADNRDYRVAMQKVSLDGMLDDQSVVGFESGSYLIAVYFFDETEVNRLVSEREQNKLVCGLINLDNYEEALESVDEVRRSLLLALIDRKISKYFTEMDGLARKLEKDKYFFVIKKASLDNMKAAKFPLLDEVKGVNIGNDMAVTASVGIGLNQGSYNADSEAAGAAIELALGRGGDQVVIKNGDATTYFGGKTESVEKGNRVKARVKAHALREIMSSKDVILVMGHKITDVDTLGSAVGIYVAGKAIGKPVHIVIDNPPSTIQPLMSGFLNNPDYEQKMFVTCREAIDMASDKAAVIVVDTSKPNYTECEELLTKTQTIVVLDHHRQSREIIRGAVLSYVEPYASSACEMVAEILQYFGDEEIRLRGVEADALYAGIMIDTNNFITRTGVRTFEAAAFLRRNGADVTRVRKMFRDSMEDYRARAQAIANAEIFEKMYAISECPAKGLQSPTVICAQAANELLNVVGIKASFVMTEFHDMVYISARAIDEVNVQIIMERLGGGGHMNIAGAQLGNMSMDGAKELLKTTIVQMAEEGDI